MSELDSGGRKSEARRAGRLTQLIESSKHAPRDALRFLGVPDPHRRRTPPVGASPGELVVEAGALAPRIHVMSFDAQELQERSVEVPRELSELLTGGRVAWIDVVGFGDEAMLHEIRETLGIHPLAMADVVNVPQRPKVERYDDRTLIVMRMARLAESGEIELEQVGLVMGPGWVATFQERPGDVFEPVRARIRSGTARIRNMSADYTAYALLDAIVDGYLPITESLGDVIDDLEEAVVHRADPSTLARIHATRRVLLSLYQIQLRQRDAIHSLVRDETSPFGPEVRVYLRDAHDHAIQILDLIEKFRETSMGLLEIHLSSASHRLNEVMKTLTIVASIFIPLSFIAGVYGMNFQFMPELGWRWGYPAVWALMIAIGVALLGWFRWRGWLARN